MVPLFQQITICLSVILYHEKSKSYYRFARQIVIYLTFFNFLIRIIRTSVAIVNINGKPTILTKTNFVGGVVHIYNPNI